MVVRLVLPALCAFVGIGALGGGGLAILVPDGSLMQAQALIPALQAIPLVGPYVDSLLLAGIALLLCIFVPQILASILLLTKRPGQYAAALLAGILLCLFTITELVFLGSNVLSWLYLLFGVIEILGSVYGILAGRRAHSAV